MAIVSCPECSKKLKVADTSVGKKVKCSCGNVFVAAGDAASAPKPAPAPAAVVAPEKVYVGCTECGAKLKVATTSLGKKMKCPKCTAVFVAEIADDAPAAPPPPPLAKPTAKKPAPKEDDLDDLFSFAQEDAANDDDGILDDDEDEAPKPKAKGKPSAGWGDDDEDETPKVKGKPKAPAGWGGDDDDSFEEDTPRAKPSAKSGWGDDDDDDDDMPKSKGKPQPKKQWDSDKPSGAPIYPSRMVANLLTVFLLLIFLGLFGALMVDINLADLAGINESKGVPKGREKNGKNLAADENKKELERFNGTWVVESAEMPGTVLEALKGQKFIFANGKVTTPDPLESAFTVDATKDPKWISLPTLSGLMVTGIYKLDGDSLQWCTALPKKIAPNQFIPGDRPTKFDPNDGVLITLSREKKKDDNNTPTKELKLPGSAGPRVKVLAKPPAGNEASLFFVSSVDDRDKPKKDWDQNFPSGTKELAVGIVFKELDENAKMKVSILTTTGAIKPAAFQDFVVTKRDEDVLVTFECLPQGGEFADGPYQAIVTLDKVDIAQLNWSVGEKVDENPKEKGKDKDAKDGKDKDAKDKEKDKDAGKDKDKEAKEKGADKEKALVEKMKALGAFIIADEGKTKSVSLGKASNELVAELVTLTSLEEINLTGSLAFDGSTLGQLKKLPKLKRLTLTSTAVTDENLAHLAELSDLQSLNVASTRVTDKGLVHLKGLEKLEVFVAPTGMTDEGMEHLKGLTNLRYLNLLGQNKITDDGVAHLKGMTKMDNLILDGARITDDGLAHLGSMEMLRDLSLVGTLVTDKGLANLSKFTEMKKLDLSTTKINGSGLTHLKDLKKLERLELRNTLVTDEVLANLKGLDALQVIDVSRSKVTDAGEKILKGILPECTLLK